MKRILMILFVLLVSAAALAVQNKTPQEKYIEEFAALAVSEMYRSGVPASITLAQGMLESGNGQSALARQSNNHFGIKCHNNWGGDKVYHDDDEKGECFRKYPHPSESYRDHSDFLRYRDRYKFLFDYKVTDYKAWAYGLKKAGYATDPKYPVKLINIIEQYDLYIYDTKPLSSTKSNKDKKEEKSLPESEVTEKLPLSPTVIEQVKELTQKQREEFHFSLSRNMYSQNDVPFVYSVAGDTYASLAASYNLFLREILKFNELTEDTELLPGTVVYVKSKKKTAAKGIDKYVIEEGDSLRDISQRYGVKLANICKLNGFGEDYIPREGDIIRLRKK